MNVFLGQPTESEKRWILASRAPAGHADTRFTFTGNRTISKNISGELGDSIWTWDDDSDDYILDYDGQDKLNKNDFVSIDIGNTVTSIGREAFAYCIGLTSVTIPNSVTSIGYYAFGDCSGLTSVTIPNSVTSIGDSAFRGCSGLTSMEIPNSVSSIGSGAFEYCSGLTSVTIGDGVTSIEHEAFNGCSGLTSVTIGNNIQRIGDGAFATYTENPITLTIGKIVAEVQAMGQTDYDQETNVTYSEWGLPSGSTIVCTNGTMPIG